MLYWIISKLGYDSVMTQLWLSYDSVMTHKLWLITSGRVVVALLECTFNETKRDENDKISERV